LVLSVLRGRVGPDAQLEQPRHDVFGHHHRPLHLVQPRRAGVVRGQQGLDGGKERVGSHPRKQLGERLPEVAAESHPFVFAFAFDFDFAFDFAFAFAFVFAFAFEFAFVLVCFGVAVAKSVSAPAFQNCWCPWRTKAQSGS
jgi:hypothetical protein